jgi:hypothetical protein
VFRRRDSRRRLIGLGSALCVVAGAAALLPGAALADSCSTDDVSLTDPGTALFDPGGYEWDTQGANSTTEYSMRNFVSFDDGGSHGPGGIPPGPRAVTDSYDEWPGLYIGSSSDDAPLATSYNSPDNNSCSHEDGGRELVFPKLTLGGLQVQFKIFVPSSGTPFARMLTLVTNPGGAPATTSVQLGGTNNNDGDFGSDEQTAVRASSSGDTAFTPADLWGVTSDHDGTTPGTNSDLALAHVLDGQGGLDRVDAVTFGAPPNNDDLALRWQGVAILPGQTASFVSFESQNGVAGADAATEDAAAAASAQAIENAVPKLSSKAATSATSTLYSGMSAREIGSLRNWPSGLTCFGRAPTIVGDDPTNDKLVGTAGADVIYSFGGNDKINGLGGKDRICGIGGKDTLKGGAGKDQLDGGSGKDKLLGGKGKDTCVGGKGKDKAGGCEKEKKIP